MGWHTWCCVQCYASGQSFSYSLQAQVLRARDYELKKKLLRGQPSALLVDGTSPREHEVKIDARDLVRLALVSPHLKKNITGLSFARLLPCSRPPHRDNSSRTVGRLLNNSITRARLETEGVSNEARRFLFSFFIFVPGDTQKYQN